MEPRAVHPAARRRTLTIGRDRGNDIVLADESVSARHARLHVEGRRCWVEDMGSTNGTFRGNSAQRVTTMEVGPDDVVRFGSWRQRVGDLLADGVDAVAAAASPDGGAAARDEILGRDSGCDLVVKDPMVSRSHARLRRVGAAVFLADLASANGTFVNGERIATEVQLCVGDTVAVGSRRFRCGPDLALRQLSERGELRIEVCDVAVDAGGRRLIEGVSFTLLPGEIAGLMGPSGSGKTTLMNAMNGYDAPSAGMVLFDGVDLFRHHERFRSQIGYVPQDDIMHGELTVYQALYFTARLRLPADSSETDIEDRIHDVLERLGLVGTEDVLIGSPERKGISGGQRKRVNIAMELLTDPAVLFLDEPTSGLSSQDALVVMNVIRQLADAGKTVLMTIHQPSLEVFRKMDHLVVLAKDAGSGAAGRLAWFGPAFPDAVRHFQPDLPDDRLTPEGVLAGLVRQDAEAWDRCYRDSEAFRTFVLGRQRQRPKTRDETGAAPRAPWWRQAATLTRRLALLKVADRRSLITLAIQPLVVAGLLVLLCGEMLRSDVLRAGMDGQILANFASKLGIAQFLAMVGALWFGCNNSVREIVGERAVYRRERMVNLRIDSYLLSKFLVLGTLCMVQCEVMLLLMVPGCAMQGSVGWSFLLLWVTALVGVGLGLAVSAAARTSEAAITMVPLLLLPMIMLGGLLSPVSKLPSEFLRGLAAAMPSRWGYEGLLVLEADARKVTSGIDAAAASFAPEARHGFGAVCAVLLGMAALLILLAAAGLRRQDRR